MAKKRPRSCAQSSSYGRQLEPVTPTSPVKKPTQYPGSSRPQKKFDPIVRRHVEFKETR
ncbi:hypothetical protein JCM18909_3304 [Cutibacterium acnes JCM 18909]|nr:hypothetical protein JCM18909_3304 [Cutibacterium acnes JCM 18909]